MNDPRLSEWFRMIGEKSCPLVCRIDGLSNITASGHSEASLSVRIQETSLSNVIMLHLMQHILTFTISPPQISVPSWGPGQIFRRGW